MPLNTVSIYDLHSMLATVQGRVQRAAVLVSKRQAMPESDPVRPHLIWLAHVALARHQAAQRLLIQKIEEAEQLLRAGLANDDGERRA